MPGKRSPPLMVEYTRGMRRKAQYHVVSGPGLPEGAERMGKISAWRTGVASSILIVVVLLSCTGCRRTTEQDRIKKVVTGVQEAAEEKNIKKVIKSLSRTYRDPQGFTYDTIKGLLLGYFFRHQTIHVYITDLEAAVEQDAGSAVFQAVLTGGEAGSAADVLPGSLGLYSFEVTFRKEHSEWKVTSARWSRVGEKPE